MTSKYYIKTKVKKYRNIFLILSFAIFLLNLYLPHPTKLTILQSPTFYAGNDRLLFIQKVVDGNERIQTDIEDISEIPPQYINCLLAAEDKTYLNEYVYFNKGEANLKNIRPGHIRGIPLSGLIRMFTDGGSSGGGSGLIQQLAKNLLKHTSKYRTMEQKYSESVMTTALYNIYSPDELLLLYLNNVPVYFTESGESQLLPEKIQYTNTFGFKTASARLFGTSRLKELTLDQFALLVTTLKGGKMTKIDSMDAIKYRRKTILKAMADQNWLAHDSVEYYSNKTIQFHTSFDANALYPGIQNYAYNEAVQIARENKLDTTLKGYSIKTTISKDIQSILSNVVVEHFKTLGLPQEIEVGVTVINPQNGHILAMIGNRNPFGNNPFLNYAYQATNMVGSTMKTFAYGAFFEKGYTPSTLLLDKDMPGKYNPEGQSTNSMQTAKYCLANSLNKPVVNMTRTFITPKDVINFAKKCGVKKSLEANPTMVLGYTDMSTLSLAAAYCPIANGGWLVPPRCVISISKNNEEKLLWSIEDASKQRNSNYYQQKCQINKLIVNQLRECLVEVCKTGTAKGIQSYYQGLVAGKTGTSQKDQDLWFVGLTPNLVAAIWVGNKNNNISMPKHTNTGGSVCAPIFGKLFKTIQSDKYKNKLSFYLKNEWIDKIR